MKLRRPSPVLIYSASRFLLFAAAAMVLYLIGARGVLLIVLAFIVSGLLSYVLLSQQRNQMARAVAGPASKLAHLRTTLDERTRAEDDLDDRLRGQSAPPTLDPGPTPLDP